MSQSHRPAGEPASSTVTVAAALAGLPLVWVTPAGETRLSPVVATTLRAALDLALGAGQPLRPLVVTADDAALEVRGSIAHPDALVISGGLLEPIEGSLTRVNGGRGEWCFRVPVIVQRPLFLMLAQGTLGLAVPWHAVQRVRLVPRDAIESTARREEATLIPPFVSVPPDAVERPMVLLALGLKRAILVADRLIWRMPADPVEGLDAPGGPSLTRAVRTADGEVFWVVDPADLMRDVEIAPVGPASGAAHTAPPAKGPPRDHAPAAPPRGRPMLQLVVLGPEHVEPLDHDVTPEGGDAPRATSEAAEAWRETLEPPPPTYLPVPEATRDAAPPASAPATTAAEPEVAEAPALEGVEAAAPEPVEVAMSEAVETAAPESVEVAAPEPVEMAAPEPVEAAAPEPVEAAAEPPASTEAATSKSRPRPLPAHHLPYAPRHIVEEYGPEPATPSSPVTAAGARPATGHRRALIAEDSIVGRIFLARLLERRGFVVEMASSAAELETALLGGTWALVLADVDLPDSPRAHHLRSGASARLVPWVALVRDRDDEALAHAAGVRNSLRKPFEPDALDRLLAVLGLPGAPA